MTELMNKILLKALPITNFLEIMETYDYPFDLSISRAADFYITTGPTISDTRVIMGLPDCFYVAKQMLKKNTPNILEDIEKGYGYGKFLKDYNYRDMLIESFNFIYVNPWELHTAIEIGESQRMALMILEKYGYVNEDVCNPSKVIYHTSLLNILKEKGCAIKIDIPLPKSKTKVPIYYTKYAQLSDDMKARVDAYVIYRAAYYDEIIDDKEESYWRYDTSHAIRDRISSVEAKKYL